MRRRTESLSDAWSRAVITSAAASAASLLALMLLSAKEGRGALRPLNATSHWLHGPPAGRRRQADLKHTATGFLTHHLATMFWSLLMEKWLGPRKRTLPELALTGGATSVLAAVVDYGLVPRRLSPGWELALTRNAMAGAFAAMAAGLAAGAFVARKVPRQHRR
jgi:hypothetical protein